jgi:hypothetical protein
MGSVTRYIRSPCISVGLVPASKHFIFKSQTFYYGGRTGGGEKGGGIKLRGGELVAPPQLAGFILYGCHHTCGGEFEICRKSHSRAAQTFGGPFVAGVHRVIAANSLVKLAVAIKSGL